MLQVAPLHRAVSSSRTARLSHHRPHLIPPPSAAARIVTTIIDFRILIVSFISPPHQCLQRCHHTAFISPSQCSAPPFRSFIDRSLRHSWHAPGTLAAPAYRAQHSPSILIPAFACYHSFPSLPSISVSRFHIAPSIAFRLHIPLIPPSPYAGQYRRRFMSATLVAFYRTIAFVAVPASGRRRRPPSAVRPVHRSDHHRSARRVPGVTGIDRPACRIVRRFAPVHHIARIGLHARSPSHRSPSFVRPRRVVHNGTASLYSVIIHRPHTRTFRARSFHFSHHHHHSSPSHRLSPPSAPVISILAIPLSIRSIVYRPHSSHRHTTAFAISAFIA